ncbi:MAG: hypothetical protein QOH88_2625 [Verrucomicrobiota bacterium]|jgi:hypothetical protein
MGFRTPGGKRSASPSVRPIAKLLVPTVPLPAVLGFAAFALGGALFLSYSFFPGGARTATTTGRSVNEVPIYSARAVPRDAGHPAAVSAQVAPAAKREAVAQSESNPNQTAEVNSSSRTLIASATEAGFKGFDGFANSRSPNSLLALGGVPTGVAMSAEFSSSGHSAPDAVSLSSVPEPSTWLAGAALCALVGGRWLRSRLRRARS